MDFLTGLSSREPSPKTDIEDLKLTEKDPKKVPKSEDFETKLTKGGIRRTDVDIQSKNKAMVDCSHEVDQIAVTHKLIDQDLAGLNGCCHEVDQTAVAYKSNNQDLASRGNCVVSSRLSGKSEFKAVNWERQGPSFGHSETITTSTDIDLAFKADSKSDSLSPKLNAVRFGTLNKVNSCESFVYGGVSIDDSKYIFRIQVILQR